MRYGTLEVPIVDTDVNALSFDIFSQAAQAVKMPLGVDPIGGLRVERVFQVVLIGTATGEGRFIAPGRLEGTHHFAFYLPSADVDGDGFPEGSPINTFNATTLDTRVLVEF